MVEQVEKRIWERIFKWSGTAAGIAVILTVVVAVAATLDRGGYVLVNTVVTGGMLALVAMGLALVFGVMNIPMFAHGEYFMIGIPDGLLCVHAHQHLHHGEPRLVPGLSGSADHHRGGHDRGGPDGGGLRGAGLLPA